MKIKQRKSLAILGVVVVSISVMLVLASLKAPPQRKAESDNRPTVSVLKVENVPVQVLVPVMGRLTATDKVELVSEVSGVLESSRKLFLTGQNYKAGEIMLHINQDETELNLKAQRSSLLTAVAALLPELKFDYPESYTRWNNYLQAFNIEATTQALPQPSNEREKFFVANKGIYNSYYTIKSQETRLAKYTIRAPFDGALIQSNITPGNLVRSSQSLGVFIKPGSFDLETSVSVNEVDHIALGDQALLSSDQQAGQWLGTVTRINQGIDEKSQMIQVFISVTAPELRENMFLKGSIQTSTHIVGLELPRKMLQGSDSVLEIADGQVLYRKVDVVSTRGEVALVQGLPDGLLISTKTMNLYDGAHVKLAGAEEQQPQAQKMKKS